MDSGGLERREDAPDMAPRSPTLGRAPAKPWRASGAKQDVSAAAIVPAKLVLDRVDQRLPRRLDDVVRDADGAPRLLAVPGGDQDARLRRRALRLVEDAHLVVEQAHRLEAGIELLEGLPQGVVERVDRPVAGGRGVLQDAFHANAHRRLGHRLTVAALLLDDDAIRFEVEVGLEPSERAFHQELERRLRALELEALVLQRLQPVEDATTVGRVLVEIDPVLRGLP